MWRRAHNQRPGWNGQSLRAEILLTADDFGFSGGVSTCIAELLGVGIVSRTSIMPCEPSTRELCTRHRKVLRGVAGCHLQIHKSRPILPAEKVGSLVTPDGTFKSADRADEMVPEHVLLEWCAQVERVRAYGLEPTHLDTHHHVHRDTKFLNVLARVGGIFSLPIRRSGSDDLDSAVPATYVSDQMTQAWTLTGRSAEELVEELVRARTGHGVVEVVCHPGYPDDELRRKSSACDVRATEYRELRRLPDLLREAGMKIIRRGDNAGRAGVKGKG